MSGWRKTKTRFWQGESQRAWRRDPPEVTLVAFYLMTCPSSHSTGLYTLSIPAMAHEIGIPFEGASKALARVCEGGFATYEKGSETVFVHEMAANQIGESLKPKDNQVKAITKHVQQFEKYAVFALWLERYARPYNIHIEPPSKALAGGSAHRDRDLDLNRDRDREDTPAPIGTDTEEADMLWSDKLTRELKSLRKTQADLAAKVLGANRKIVQGWCNGKVTPSDDERDLVDKAIGLFRKQHQAVRSKAKRYQDDVCLAFEEMFLAKFEHRPTWVKLHFAAIKRWREAGHSTQLVIDKARIMLSWHGSKWPCKDSCDFGTLLKHFDKFSEVKKADRDIREGRAEPSSRDEHLLDRGRKF